MARWSTQAPAKINRSLRMRGRRADGYHLLSTVLQSIALADTLTLECHEGPFVLQCDAPGVPTDATNLAWKGAAAMASALGVPLTGWRLTVHKAVPAEAGLGGGSADAAAAARLVAAAAGQVVAPEALARIIGPLGADVAYFAWGGTVLGEGVGDQLTPGPDAPSATVVLVRPPFGVSTREAYGWYDEDTAAARGQGADGVNDLEGPVVARHPTIGDTVTRLREAGADLAAMSGSGSACFGLFAPGHALEPVRSGWPAGTQVWTTHTLDRAAYARATAVVSALSKPDAIV